VLYEFSTLEDVVFSLTLIALALIVFIRLVHDYRIVYTIGNLCRKSYRIEYRPSITVPLNLHTICRNVDIVHAESPHAESANIVDDHIELNGLSPDIVKGEVELYVYVRVYGMLDTYTLRRKIVLRLV